MDINTKTSSTMTPTENNVGPQLQRMNKSDTSFKEEMNKFSVEQNEDAEITVDVEKNNTIKSTKIANKKPSSLNKNSQIQIDINLISLNKTDKNNIETTKQNNTPQDKLSYTNTVQIIQQHSNPAIIVDKQQNYQADSLQNKSQTVVTNDSITSQNNQHDNLSENIASIKDATKGPIQNSVMAEVNKKPVKNSVMVEVNKEPVKNSVMVEVNKSINKIKNTTPKATKEISNVVTNIDENANKLENNTVVSENIMKKHNNEQKPAQPSVVDNTKIIEDSTLSITQPKDSNKSNKVVENKNIENSIQKKTEIITKEIKATKTSKKISDRTLEKDIIEQTHQIINEVTTVTTQDIKSERMDAMPLQSTPVIDNMQTLIDANKQLADITLLTDAKVVETKITTVKTDADLIKVDYSTVKMSAEDAVFFADLIQDTEKTLQNVVADIQSEVEQKVQEASKNVKVSATLMEAISQAAKTNQPMRIDFDKDISVIIKIDKDGSINAKFIPGDKAVEEYLKQNISALRQRFDEQELNYRDLSYSNRQRQNQENSRRNNKEKDHE